MSICDLGLPMIDSKQNITSLCSVPEIRKKNTCEVILNNDYQNSVEFLTIIYVNLAAQTSEVLRNNIVSD